MTHTDPCCESAASPPHPHSGASAGPARMSVSEHAREVRELIEGIWQGPGGPRIEHLPVREAAGRILASDVRARVSVPPRDNSQMDGFVYRVADVEVLDGEVNRLPLGALIAAGDPPSTLEPGTARPIMTGALIPEGADTVIPVEETSLGSFKQVDAVAPSEEGTLSFPVGPQHRDSGRFVRRAGSDTEMGDVVAREGTPITPRLSGHLASVGLSAVPVLTRPRVLIVSTGSELANPEEPDSAKPWQIFDSNTVMLAATLAEYGLAVAGTVRVGDAQGALLAAVGEALQGEDIHLIVSTGGVSAGAVEPLRQAAGTRGPHLRMAFHKVAMQPGGPQALGVYSTGEREIPWVGLPGNPVSAFLSAEMFIRPAVGAAPRPRVRVTVATQTGEPEASPEGLLQLRRARLTSEGSARLVGGPGSHLLGALALSDSLVLIPPHVTQIRDGETYEVLCLS